MFIKNFIKHINNVVAVSFFILSVFLLTPLQHAAAAFQVDSSSTLSTSLVSYYRFDESATGTTSVDAVSSRDLSNFGSTPFVAGKINNAGDGGSGNPFN